MTTLDNTAEQAARDRRRSRTRRIFGVGGAYTVLIGFAAVMLFPFVYMVATALKTPEDTFRYPPKVLPRAPITTTVDGVDVPLFSLPIDGGEANVFLAEEGVEAGVFVDPASPEDSLAWPMSLATETGATATLDGESVPVYTVQVGSEARDLAFQRGTVVGRFVGIDDPSIETFAVVRIAEQESLAEGVAPQWGNFREVTELRDVDRALTNTILVTILVVAGTLFTSIMGGYAFSRLRFKGRDAIFLAYVGSIMIPFTVLIIPLFRLMVSLGWIDTLGSLVWPFLFNAYGTFLMRQFFVSIPKDLEEAAVIDGAKRWKILWGIFVPLSWPAIATLATFMFLYAWNSFIWPLVSINGANSDDFVLTIALSTLGGQSGEGPNLIFAAIVLSVTVPFLVFAFAQRYFVENVATSGIK
ncbi:MAG: carbohydrate ABC transporter permease [Acidimicrobiia bacterium]|nr:carbohydrate ABC transporter permease [Acidimicrobiia bacterium]MDH5294627.1 carbohydrate ABC transporter permease [Acidimicrobiia bacterium]